MPPPKVHGSPAGIRKAVEDALAVLDGVKSIDIFEMARVDPDVDIEISIAALGELVEEGKIGAIGLSEVSLESIQRAAKVHQIACVEVELSLFSTEIVSNGVLDTCKECKYLSSYKWLVETLTFDSEHSRPGVLTTRQRLLDRQDQITRRPR